MDMSEEALDLSPLKVVGEFDDTDLQAFMDTEDGLDPSQEVTGQNAVRIAAAGALDSRKGRDVEVAPSDSESKSENEPTLQPSTSRYLKAVEAFTSS